MRYTLTALISMLLFAQSPSRGQAPSRPTVSADSVRAQAARAQAVHDTALVRMERAYREILEKTNAQLGVWTNPYGVMIAALGVLFTVGAIVVAVLIFRQGSEFRTLIKQSITDYQNILNAFIEEKNKHIEILKQSFTEHIERLSKDHEKATDEQKKKIAAEIESLRELQKALKQVEPPTPLWVTGSHYGSGSHYYGGFGGGSGLGGPAPSTATLMKLGQLFTGQHVCSKCGTTYPLPPGTGGVLGASTATLL